MEEGKTKKGKGSTIVIILLIIIILGLVGYIYYSSNITSKETKKADNTIERTEEETVISDSLISSLLDLVPYYDNVFGAEDEKKDLVPYYKDKYVVSDIDDELLIFEAYNYAVNSGEINVQEKGDFQTGVGSGKCISISDLNKYLKKNYNTTIVGESKEFGVPELGTAGSFYMTSEDICLVPQESGMTYSYITSKTNKVEYNNEDIIVYTSVLFNYFSEVDTCGDDWCINHTIYSDAAYKNVLEKQKEKTEGLSTIDAEKLFKKYYGQAAKYKHTFKPNDDGGYYWYSTEKVE